MNSFCKYHDSPTEEFQCSRILTLLDNALRECKSFNTFKKNIDSIKKSFFGFSKFAMTNTTEFVTLKKKKLKSEEWNNKFKMMNALNNFKNPGWDAETIRLSKIQRDWLCSMINWMIGTLDDNNETINWEVFETKYSEVLTMDPGEYQQFGDNPDKERNFAIMYAKNPYILELYRANSEAYWEKNQLWNLYHENGGTGWHKCYDAKEGFFAKLNETATILLKMKLEEIRRLYVRSITNLQNLYNERNSSNLIAKETSRALVQEGENGCNKIVPRVMEESIIENVSRLTRALECTPMLKKFNNMRNEIIWASRILGKQPTRKRLNFSANK